MNKKLPIVAIVGRANVGKSSLFNAILNRREAIVAREPGTTRDSVSAKASFRHQDFWLVDTAGIKDPVDDFEFTIQEQIAQAADTADVIWVVVEADVPVLDEDRRVARMALKTTKPVVLVINKIDKVKKVEVDLYKRLGISDIQKTSAINNRGINDLLEDLIAQIPKASEPDNPDRLTVAIVGRPNVGKSNLFNAMLKKQQAIVSDRAGTTRDTNRSIIKYKGREIELLDTAGIRRNGKIKVGVERFSVIRALYAIDQADICLVLMDVNELNVQLDQKIAGMVKEAGKGLILIVSKWDAYEDKDPYSRDQIAKEIAAEFEFVPWAPLVFTSSITGQNVTRIFDLALEIDKTRQTRIATKDLNNWLRQAVLGHPPAGLKNRSPKLNYMVQETDNPIPAFKIFGSSTKFVHWSYRRYLETRLRQAYGFNGTPVQLWFIEKHTAHKHGVSPTKEAS
ncbi:MAG TPA: ribosome biogenesis GTPase Der [Candidatus Sulfotelmatobacter sp.]|nr:ribosome biogenesis GTPase Der [Candidatus Sulfotelmatobacter sp.]